RGRASDRGPGRAERPPAGGPERWLIPGARATAPRQARPRKGRSPRQEPCRQLAAAPGRVSARGLPPARQRPAPRLDGIGAPEVREAEGGAEEGRREGQDLR